MYETMVRGEFMCGGRTNEPPQERWGFYNVYDFQYPSDAELKKLKAIVIPGSPASVLDD